MFLLVRWRSCRQPFNLLIAQYPGHHSHELYQQWLSSKPISFSSSHHTVIPVNPDVLGGEEKTAWVLCLPRIPEPLKQLCLELFVSWQSLCHRKLLLIHLWATILLPLLNASVVLKQFVCLWPQEFCDFYSQSQSSENGIYVYKRYNGKGLWRIKFIKSIALLLFMWYERNFGCFCLFFEGQLTPYLGFEVLIIFEIKSICSLKKSFNGDTLVYI